MTLYCECESPLVDVEHDAGCRRCGRPVDFSPQPKYTPKPGEVVVVPSIPACNFCNDGTPGPYDFATTFGPWANGCEAHWKMHRARPTLGVGSGQFWITEDQAKEA